MDSATVVGIDVGGTRKGMHAVALRNGVMVGALRSPDVAEVQRWCADEHHARVVAIDAPCAWSTTRRARAAERALTSAGVFCYATPTRDAALGHPRDHFRWMLCGEQLYAAIQRKYTLFSPKLPAEVQAVCVETYPHAVACALSGAVVSARRKSATRRAILIAHRITGNLPNIDWVDAAFCALTAQALADKHVSWVGDASEGYIVMPRTTLIDRDRIGRGARIT